MSQKKNRKWWWIIGGTILLIIILITCGQGKNKKGTKVAVEAASEHTIVESVTGSGKIYPETEVKLSPEVSGEIVELTVEEGDTVKKGQLLARINSSIYQSQVSQAQASVQQNRATVNYSQDMAAQSQAQYEQALATYNRNKKLYSDRVISAQEYEQAEAAFKSARATYQAAQANIRSGKFGVQVSQANLNQARESLRRTAIYAPTDGVISSLKVKQGERVVGTAQMAGTEMLTIADLSRIEVRVDVGETDITKVKIGDTALVEADAYRGRKFKGTVSKIAVSSVSTVATQTNQITNYTVHILLHPESYADLLQQKRIPFKPGMSASVEIITRKDYNVLSVPVNAVTTRDWPDSIMRRSDFKTAYPDIRQVVFVYDEKKKEVSIRDVSTGIQDNMHIFIKSGLRKGEKVVIAPYGAIARTLKHEGAVQIVEKEKLFEASESEPKD